jgi:hypothetical protein
VNDPVVAGCVTKKNDFNVSSGLNIGNLSSGFHASASYAMTNKLMVTGSFTGYRGSCSSTNFDYADSSTNVFYSGRKFGLGFGYYRPLNENNYFELIGGGQFGISINEREAEKFEYHYLKYLIQPGLVHQTGRIQAGLCLRFGVIDYLNFPTGSFHEIQHISTKSPNFYIDPGVFVCAGGPAVKLGIQLNYTLSQQSSIGYTYLGQYLGTVIDDPLSISLFLRLSLPSKAQN